MGTCDPIADQLEGARVYILRVNSTFQGVPPGDGVIFVKTAVQGSLCGVQLEEDVHYFFNFGPCETDSRHCPSIFRRLSVCDFPSPWDQLSLQEEKFLLDRPSSGRYLNSD